MKQTGATAMKQIFVIQDNNEIITARDTMDNAIVACMKRMVICGYICEGFNYDEELTTIVYRDHINNHFGSMSIERATYKEGA